MTTIVTQKTHLNGVVSYEKDSWNDEFWYNDTGLLTRRKNADGFEQHWEYASNGNVLRYWTSEGLEFKYEYSDNGNCIAECVKSRHSTTVADPRWIFDKSKNKWVSNVAKPATFGQKLKDKVNKVFGKA